MKGDITHKDRKKVICRHKTIPLFINCMHEWVHSTPPDCNILQDSYSPVNWPILTLWGGGLTFIGLFNGDSSMSTICPQITPRGIQRKTLKAFPALIFDMTEPCLPEGLSLSAASYTRSQQCPSFRAGPSGQLICLVYWVSFDKNVGGFLYAMWRETKKLEGDIDCRMRFIAALTVL